MIVCLLFLVLITGYMVGAEIMFEHDWPRRTIKGFLISLLLLFMGLQAFGQASRYDQVVSTVNTSAPIPGGLYPALYIPGAGIAICAAPANAVPCTNYATTYSSAAKIIACIPPAQMTRPGSTQCVAKADSEGGFGVWMDPGTYQYTITTTYGSFGPYDFTVGGVASGGSGIPAGVAVIQGSNAAGSAFISTNEIVGSQFSTPQQAVDVACGSSHAVYFPAGNYANGNVDLAGCSGLRMRCTSSNLQAGTTPTFGTVFQVTGANYGLQNSSGTTVTNIFIDGCTWNIAGNSAALAGVNLKGISHSNLFNIGVFSNNNPNPAWIEDGVPADYDTNVYGMELYENSSTPSVTSVGILTRNGSNEVHHFGGSDVRYATSLLMQGGNNNTWMGTDFEGFANRCIDMEGNVPSNYIVRGRCETVAVNGSTSWPGAAQVVATGTVIFDGTNAQIATVGGTTGGGTPSWNTTIWGTTTDGSVTWQTRFQSWSVYFGACTYPNCPRDNVFSLLNEVDAILQNEGNGMDVSDGQNIARNVFLTPMAWGQGTTSRFETIFTNKDVNAAVGIDKYPTPPDDNYLGGILNINGEIQLNRYLLWENFAAVTPSTSYTQVGTNAQTAQHFNFPDSSNCTTTAPFCTILTSGSDLIATPTGTATAVSGNIASYFTRWDYSYWAGAVVFLTYQSGGTITGTAGQTCNVGSLNNSSTATGTFTLTGTNTIAVSTPWFAISQGTGATSPPTTAVLTNGSATCSGTVTIATILGASTGQFIANAAPGTGMAPSSTWAIRPITPGTNTYQFWSGDLFILNPTVATSGLNQPASTFRFLGGAWNGSANVADQWIWTPALAAGSNPASTLTLTHTGPGTGTLALPAGTTCGGTPCQSSAVGYPLTGTTGTTLTSAHGVFAAGALAGGTLAVTLSGAAIYTSSSSYMCLPQDTTTPANAVTVAYSSGTAFTLTGTGTDAVRFQCTGN